VTSAVRDAIARYRSTPRSVTPWRLWALRRALSPLVALPCRLTAFSTFDLAADPVDDWILEDVLGPLRDVYFPADIERLDDPLILEIGAHSGIVAVELLRRAPRGWLVALEPNPLAATRLRHHLHLNGVAHRSEVIECALGDADGNVRLHTSREGSWGDSTYPGNNAASYLPDGIVVRSKSLAQVLQGRTPDLIVCNAEGAEFAMIPQLIALDLRPRVMVLMTHRRHGDVDGLLEHLRAHGFVVTAVGDDPEHFHCRPRP
jgi:FkbM family methyltransferase